MYNVPGEAIRAQITSLIPVYMNTLMIGCATGWLANAVYFLLLGEEVQATSSQCVLVATLSEVGRVMFALPAGVLADKFGRKIITLCAAFLDFFACLGLSLDTSLSTIYIGRFTIGAAQALMNTVSLTIVGETSSPEVRGNLTSIYQIFMNVGFLIPSIISVIFCSYKWLTWSATFLSVATLFSMLWAIETPNFLVSVSKLKQAKCNLEKIRKGYPANKINEEFEKLQTYIEDEKTRKSRLNWLTFVKLKSIRTPLLIGIFINFFTLSTGSQVVRAYVTAIIPANDIVPTRFYPLNGQILTLIVAFLSTLYIERFPRRTIFLIGTATMALITAFGAFSRYFMDENQDEKIFKLLFFFSNASIVICYGMSIQPMTNTLNSELYPQAVKGFCLSLVTMSQATSLVASYQLYGLINEYFQLYLMYVVFSISSLMLFLVVYFFLPEGRGEFLTDLQMKFKPESSPRDNCNVEMNSQK